MRRFFIHCGLHKTASTSLQNSLTDVAEDLRGQGLLFPVAGRVDTLSGQHNLAWRLARDRRFHESYGDIAALSRELVKWDGDVVISSEDFESSLLHPERWPLLLGPVIELGFKPVIIIYRRNPDRYLDSLYLEELLTGFRAEYQSMAREALETGTVRIEDWEFCFDFGRIVAAMSSLPGVEVVVRDFEHLASGSITGDFAVAIGASAAIADILGRSERRDNARIGLESALIEFLRGRDPALAHSGIWLDGMVHRFIKSQNGRAVAPRRLRVAMTERFGTATAFTPDAPTADRNALFNIANVFSFETHRVFRRLNDLMVRGMPGPDLERQIAYQASEWRRYAQQLD